MGLALGLILGGFLQINIPPEYTRYTAVAIVGVLDSVFGAVRASIDNKYNTTIFITGLIFNMIFAVIITFFGDKLNLDLYLAVSIAFMIRILSNIGSIKTATVNLIQKKITKVS
jgi:small basic protein